MRETLAHLLFVIVLCVYFFQYCVFYHRLYIPPDVYIIYDFIIVLYNIFLFMSHCLGENQSLTDAVYPLNSLNH